MKALGFALALVVAAIAAFAVVAALQPAEFRIERSVAIAAPAEVVFAQVNDLHEFQEFSPWAKRDPAAKNTFEGPQAGTGASFAWAGNADIGEGRMTITESHPSDLIRIRLDFRKPFASTANTDFVFKSDGDGTVVTWSMDGRSDFAGKAMGLLMSMDKLIGGDFEAGLARLKSLSESAAPS